MVEITKTKLQATTSWRARERGARTISGGPGRIITLLPSGRRVAVVSWRLAKGNRENSKADVVSA